MLHSQLPESQFRLVGEDSCMCVAGAQVSSADVRTTPPAREQEPGKGPARGLGLSAESLNSFHSSGGGNEWQGVTKRIFMSDITGRPAP